jgi:hypothetical protein
VFEELPTSAVQGQNLLPRGAVAAPRNAAGALGAHVLGPLGALGGEMTLSREPTLGRKA